MERAVRKLKSGKAGGVCGIQVEMVVKAGGYTVVQWLKDIFDIYSLELWKGTSRMEGDNHCTYI